MNKKGFTLVELLAILVVLGIIIVVAMPALVESNRVAKNNETNDYKELIETACDTYVAAPPESVNPSIDDEVTVEFLEQKGYIKKNVKVPGDKEKSNIKIKVTNQGCKYQSGL